MPTDATERPFRLRLERRFTAPREKVFRAWTDPEALKQWFGPPGWGTHLVRVDLRVGGEHRVGMTRLSDGEVLFVSGTYREVSPPQRLVYTWRWEQDDMDVGETLVTVDFLEEGEETRLVLTHELFPSAKASEEHQAGWTGCLDRLQAFV